MFEYDNGKFVQTKPTPAAMILCNANLSNPTSPHRFSIFVTELALRVHACPYFFPPVLCLPPKTVPPAVPL